MPLATKRKRARESTAAYIASQPLFDSLRRGVNQLNSQSEDLTTARDLVQNLHVKVIDNAFQDDHERYIDNVLKAWRSATETYAGIFEALADVTAAQPNEGKAARHGHEDFAAMAKTATAASGEAMKFALYEEGAKDEAATAGGATVTPEVEMVDAEDAVKGADREVKLKKALGKKKKLATDNTVSTSEHLTKQANDEPTNSAGVAIAKNQEMARQRREKKKQRRAANSKQNGKVANAASGANGIVIDRRAPPGWYDKNNASLQNGTTLADLPEATNGDRVPGVKYENVDAEVDAKIREEQEQKEKAKKEKKRKRQSADSLLTAHDEVKTEKPSKKKAKGEAATAVANGGAEVKAEHLVAKKRGADEDVVNGESKKKRKQVKG